MTVRLYVGNLADDVSTDTLRTRFAECGVVSDVHLAIDRSSGRMRGYAFITMETSEGARTAIERLNGALVEDRPLRVNEAGEEREGSRSANAANERKNAVKITMQFRERSNMIYELDCAGVLLSLRMSPTSPEEDAWRVEATTKNGAGGNAVDVEGTVTGEGATRALAVDDLARAWVGGTSRKEPVDWNMIIKALLAVRAV